MINKYTNKQRGLLAVIMAMVMVFAGAAFVAAEADGEVSETTVVKTDEEFKTAVTSDDINDITLGANITYTGDIEKAGKTIDGAGKFTLDLKSTTSYEQIRSTVTFNNITLTNTSALDWVSIAIKNYSFNSITVTFNNVTFKAGENGGILNTFNGKDTNIVFNSCIFDNSSYEIQNKAIDTTITVNDTVIPQFRIYGENKNGEVVGKFVIGQDLITIGEKTSITDLYLYQNAIIDVPSNVHLKADKVTGTGMITIGENASISGTIDAGIIVIDSNSNDSITVDNLEKAEEVINAGAPSVVVNGETIKGEYTIPEGGELILGEDSEIDKNAIITIPNTSKLTASSAPEVFTAIVDDNEIILTGLKGSFTISKGSVMVNGTNVSGSVTVEAGTATISGSVEGVFKIIKGSGDAVIFKNLTINNGSTLEIASGLEYEVDENMYVYGSLIVTDDPLTTEKEVESIKVQTDSAFKAFGGATIPETVIIVGEANAKIDLGDAMSTMTINDDVVSSNTYSQMQTVVIADTLTLKNTTVTTILGKFIVNEGVTLTIEKGAKLVINSTTADMVVNGEIIVEEGAELIVENAKDVAISGQISSEGIVSVDGTVTIKEGGSIIIENEDSSSIVVEKGLTIEKGAELIVKSNMNINNVSNKGTVTLDGAILSNDSEITMAADGAKVEVRSFIGDYKLTITDEGVILGKDENKNDVRVSESNPTPAVKNYNRIVTKGGNEIGLGGFTTTYSVTSIKDDGKIKYSNEFIIAGTVAIIDETNDDKDKSATIYIGTYGGSKVIDSLTIGKGIDMVVSYGKISIDGTVTAVASDSSINMSGGMMTVEGLVQTISKISKNINAAKYQADVNGVTNYYYTSFSKAVASGDDEIEILGNIKVLEDVTVPEGIKVKNNGTMEVGDSKNRDVTVTFADGSELRNGKVTVNGTVVFDNKKNEKSVSITSDVVVTGEISKMYTNLYTALANAKPGDVVTVNGDDIKIDADLTIPEGVTLDIISGKTMTINNDITLTVDGTLRTASAVLAQTAFADEASENESCIIVNGTFMSMDDIEFTNYNIPGAYYNIVDASGNYDYVTPVEAVETVAQKVTNGVIDIYGENKVSDVTLAGTEDLGLEITIQTGADIDLSTMTLAYATLTITGTVNGTVGSDAGSIEFVDVKSAVVTVDADADGTVMNIAGTLADGGDSNVKSKVTIESGTVTVAAALDVKNMEKHISISAGAELSVIKSGTFEAKQVTIDGELYVTDSGSVKITEKMTVLGTFEVAEADTEANTAAGNATIATMYVGMTSKQVTGEGATIIGKPTIEKLMYVDASATIPADLIKDKKFVEFYVEDALWMTVYDFSAIGNVEVKEIPVENVKLVTWTDKDGKRVTTSATNAAENYTVKIEDNKVYAKINYNVYLVKIWAAEGIDDVYIDGILVPGSALIGEYATQYVSAGTHTISYTLANGYTGSAQMVINDKLVSGYTFTAEGDYDDVEYIIKLQGIEKAPAEVGGGDAPVADKDEGMDLTDILLIVLVVLIVIMAIIVALRMMRS